LSWPAVAASFSLQSTASLTPPIDWHLVSNPVNVAGEKRTVTVSLTDRTRFFRLRKP
jgi:hypothetical protein